MNTPAYSFFFRAADRMRMKGCVNALTQDAMNLAICCEQEALLDHYLSILLSDLAREAPWLHQDVYFPTNTDYLLALFNELLADQSVEDATRTAQDRGQARVWVVHDAQALPEAELQLLARLIQNFPGANIRVLLAMTGPSARHSQLSAFGRKLLTWDIEPPGREQALLMLEATAIGPDRVFIEGLLRKMGYQPSFSASETVDSRSLDVDESGVQNHAQGMPLQSDSVPLSPLRRQCRTWFNTHWPAWRTSLFVLLVNRLPALSKWAGSARLPAFQNIRVMPWIGLGLLLSALLVTAVFQPSIFGLKVAQGNKSKQMLLDGENVDGNSTTAPQRAASENNTATINQLAVGTATQPPTTSAGTGGGLVGHEWAKQLPPLSFVLQHASLTSLTKAQNLVKSNPVLRQAKIVITYRQGDPAPQYLVLSGPYEPVGQAYEKARLPGTPAGTWVRSSSDMQGQLQIPASFLQNVQ